MRIRTQCKACGLPYRARLERGDAALVCPNCAAEVPLDHAGWSDAPPPRVDTCPLCAGRHFYRERDFNRILGCGLVLLGAVFVPWTYGLSLVALSLVDLALYYRLPKAVVCYQCDTMFRDARPTERQTEVDLLKHDVLKYGKTWQEIKDLDADPEP